MGFECGFSIFKKYKDCQTVKDYEYIRNYVEWKNNPWNFKEGNYPTFEKYCKSVSIKYTGEPDLDVVAHYENIFKDPFETKDLFAWWGSSGRQFDDFIKGKLEKDDNDNYLVTKDFAETLFKWTTREISDCEPIHITPTRGVKEDDQGNLIVSRIDGLECEDDNGKLFRLDAMEYYDEYYCNDSVFLHQDDEKYYALSQLRIVADNIKTLLEIDSDLVVWYWRSY